jgi:hypothetical protein
MREVVQRAGDTPLGGAWTGATPFSLRRAILGYLAFACRVFRGKTPEKGWEG